MAPNVAGNAAAANAFVTAVNSAIGLRGPTAFPADGNIVSTGAFGLCSALQGAIANPPPPLRAVFATPTGPLPFTLEPSGVPVNLRGNKLPQAPTWKFSAGAQYTHQLANDWTLFRASTSATPASSRAAFLAAKSTRSTASSRRTRKCDQ